LPEIKNNFQMMVASFVDLHAFAFACRYPFVFSVIFALNFEPEMCVRNDTGVAFAY